MGDSDRLERLESKGQKYATPLSGLAVRQQSSLGTTNYNTTATTSAAPVKNNHESKGHDQARIKEFNFLENI